MKTSALVKLKVGGNLRNSLRIRFFSTLAILHGLAFIK